MLQPLWQGYWMHTTNSDCFLSTFQQSLLDGDVGMMEYLGNKPPHIPKFDQIKWSCLHTIAYAIHPLLKLKDKEKKKQLEKLTTTLQQLFVKHGADLRKFSKYGYLPIHLACQTNNYLILEMIIKILVKQSNENVLNTPTNDKHLRQTPLIIAIKNNSIDCVRLLCQQEYIVKNILKYKSRYPNYNAFEFACYYSNRAILKLLLSHIAKNGNKNELSLLQTQSPIMIEIVNRGVRNRGMHSVCVELLSTELSKEKLMVNTNDINDTSQIMINNASPKKESMIDIDNCLAKLDLVCLNGHKDMWQIKSKKPLCNLICECGHTTTGSMMKCKSCNQIMCKLCVIATSIWTVMTRKYTTSSEMTQMISHHANHDIMQRVESNAFFE